LPVFPLPEFADDDAHPPIAMTVQTTTRPVVIVARLQARALFTWCSSIPQPFSAIC
jgi:hypothetical protein